MSIFMRKRPPETRQRRPGAVAPGLGRFIESPKRRWEGAP